MAPIPVTRNDRPAHSAPPARPLSTVLFAGGWAFFIPYIALYLAAWALQVSNGSLRTVFLIGHATFLLAFAQFSARSLSLRYRSPREVLRDPAFWFWGVLILGFLLPGAYLEFPGDPWEHFRRLHLPGAEDAVEANLYLLKFSYFWGWTFLSLLKPGHQRVALHVYSAFWQVLVAIQFYRLSRRLGFSPAWSRIQVIAVVALFGNGIMSFFRYFALASTPLAYIAYLRGAIAVLDIADGRGRETRAFPAALAAVVIMAVNHFEELLLFSVFALTVVLLQAWSWVPRSQKALAFAGLVAVFVGGLALGRLVMANPTAYAIDPGRLQIGGAQIAFFSHLGTYRIWEPRLSYARTIGLHGLVSAVLAVVFWRARPMVAALTLAPIALLLFPPFAILFALMTNLLNTWRVLFAFPGTFMIVSAGQALAASIGRGAASGQERLVQAGALGAVLAAGCCAVPPVYGKLPFQYYRPAPCLTLRFLDPVADWFAINRPRTTCVVMSDPVTEFGLCSFRGTAALVNKSSGQRRVWDPSRGWTKGGAVDWGTPQGILDYYRATLASVAEGRSSRACGFLVVDDALYGAAYPEPCRSWIGTVMGHWAPDAADLRARQPPHFSEAAAGLATLGWTKTFVPPFYWYYEPGSSR
jgi:hypothetical protein